MTQPVPSSELIDLAWNAVQASNLAFDRMREPEVALDQLRAVGNLGLAGVTIGDEAYSELEGRHANAQAEFDLFTSMAAPAMLMEDSPFAVSSKDTDFAGSDSEVTVAIRKGAIGHAEGPSDVAPDDLVAFAEQRGYSRGQATRVWMTIEREGIPRDARSLRDAVAEWLSDPPDIRNLGSRGISFLADYLNQQISGIEPLVVRHPPESRPSKAAEVSRLEPRELLFDEATIDGTSSLYVSHASFARFIVSKGHSPHRATHSASMFADLVRVLEPSLLDPRFTRFDSPTRITDDLVYIGQYESGKGICFPELGGTHLWGISPSCFIRL